MANGREVNLTRKEFDLLRTLMENKGRVLTREQLLEQGRACRRDAHGGHAREDAAAQAGRGGPAEEAVATVRGVGYRLKKSAS
ncbi:MAG: winged helix-turn-helix domain-containing protein [Adlercreutzia equolifaciens]